MMQWMHRLSQSWAASLLMGALALSFVVWGIADVFTGQSSTALATVGSTEISGDMFQRSYKNYLRNQSQQMGMQITPEMAQKMGLGDVALQQLVSRTALDNAIDRMHLTTPDATLAGEVRSMQAFRSGTGQFDHRQFLSVIQNAGYTEQEFLAEMRADMTRGQLTGAFEQGFGMPDGYVRAIFLYLTEKRAVQYLIVSPDSLPAVAAPSDAVLAGYVKAHPDRFSTPEYRQIEYAQISPEDMTGQVQVTDAMVAQDYAAHKAIYQVAEKRDIEQIEFPTEAAAKAARTRIDAGASFDALAAERKIKPADLVLGELAKNELPDPARAEVAFALPQGVVSQPVKGAIGGYVLMRVTKIVPGISRTLGDVKDEIRKNLALQAASGKLIDVVNAFEDARSGGADIAAAARKTGMKAGRFAAIDKTGATPSGEKVPGLPADPEFLAKVFSAEVGEDSDPFPAKSGTYYAIKVDGVTPPKLKPLDMVRADALAAWSQDEKSAELGRRVVALAAQAQRENSLDGVAKTLKVPVQQSPALGRDTNDTTFSAGLVGKIFNAPAGGIIEDTQAIGANFILARVTGISHTLPAPASQTFKSGKAQLSQEVASDLTVSFANAARLQQGVKVNQKMLESALGGNQ